MRVALAIGILALSMASAWAQTSRREQPATVVPSPFQALGNIIRNRNTPPPQTSTGHSLALPTAIPPDTIGANPSKTGR
jgi:hypothetical protein